jgi:hypothetical protein
MRKLDIPVIDDRTDDMPDEALGCRAYSHQWVRTPVDRARLLELLEQGCREIVLVCSGGCGQSIHKIYNRSTGELVEQRREYGDRAYLVPKGTGRMTKNSARVALWYREDRDLYRRTPRR